MDNILSTPKVTTGPLPASQKIYITPEEAPDISVPLREITQSVATEPKIRVYDTTGPYTDPTVAIDVSKGLARVRRAWVMQRGGVEEYTGRPIQPIDNGNVKLAALIPFANTPKPLRGLDGHKITQYEWAKAGVITKEMIYVAARENLGRKHAHELAAERIADGEGFGGQHMGMRAQRDCTRPCDHSRQHQPHRVGADDHRPQLPGEDQRQHRQLGGLLLDGGRGREDGVVDPLGRRHGHGPVDRPQHPRHARMDRAQRADSDRHRADLPGPGEGGRRSYEALVGSLPRHADRAGRAGR